MKTIKLLTAIIFFVFATATKAQQLKVDTDSLEYQTESKIGNFCYKHRIVNTVINSSGPATINFKFALIKNLLGPSELWIVHPNGSVNGGFTKIDTTVTYQTPFQFKVVIWDGSIYKAPGSYKNLLKLTDVGNTNDTVLFPIILKLANQETVEYSYISGPNNYYYSSTGSGKKDSCDLSNFNPVGNFVPPARGGSYTDPHFGANITIVGDSGYTNAYGGPSSVSAHNKYVLTRNWWTFNPQLVDPQGNIIKVYLSYDNSAGFAGGVDVWDAYNDSIMYGLRGNLLYKFNVITQHAEIFIDYGKSPYNIKGCNTGGTGDATKDNYYAFFSDSSHVLCVVNLNTKKTYIRDYDLDAGTDGWPGGFGEIDWVDVARGWDKVSGKRYMMVVTQTKMGIYSIDTLNNKIDFEYFGPELVAENDNGNIAAANFDCKCDPGEICFAGQHTALTEDAQGNQYIASYFGAYRNYTGAMGVLLIRAGEQKLFRPYEFGGGKRIIEASGGQAVTPRPMYPSVPYNASADFQIGPCRNAPFFITANASAGRPIDDKTSFPIEGVNGDLTMYGLFANKIVVRKIAKHRSINFYTFNDKALPYDSLRWTQYFAYAKPSLSPDGSVAVCCSNFGLKGYSMNLGDPNYFESGSSSIRTFCAETKASEILAVKESSQKNNAELLFSVYPNPSNGYMAVLFDAPENKPTIAKVVDMQGKLVFEKKITASFGEQNVELYLSEISKGAYMLQLINGDYSRSEMITIE